MTLSVILANAGIQNLAYFHGLDSRLRGMTPKMHFCVGPHIYENNGK